MALDLYTPAELAGVVETITPTQNFFIDTFFNEEHTFETEEILFDKIDTRIKIAPFVAPNIQGRPQKRRGYKTSAFKPAYLKPKNPLTPNMAFPRRPGEPIGQPLSPSERWDAMIAKELADQRASIERRWEWLAAQATLFAKVVIEAEDYPSTTVDFGRDPTHTVVLTGTARWGQAAADISGNLEAWATLIQNKTGGVVTTVFMSTDVWAVVRKDPFVQKLMDIRRGSVSNGELGPLNDLRYRYVVTLGAFDLYTYSDVYIDENDVDQPFMPPNTVLMVAPQQFRGARCYGAILDSEAILNATPIYAKMWSQPDPSVTFVMSQSAPLMVPLNPDASLVAHPL